MIWRNKGRSRIGDVKLENFKNILGIRIIERMSKYVVRDLNGIKRTWMKGLRKAFFFGLTILKEWKMEG